MQKKGGEREEVAGPIRLLVNARDLQLECARVLVLFWFDHVKRMEMDRIAKRVYVEECAGSRSVGRSRKRWINTVKECLKKRGLDVVRQASRMVQDRSGWQGFVRGECMGRSLRDEPKTLT